MLAEPAVQRETTTGRTRVAPFSEAQEADSFMAFMGGAVTGAGVSR